MRLTRRLKIATVIAVSMLAACNAAASPSAGSSPSAAASPSAGSSLTGRPWALTAVTSKTPAFQGEVPDYQQPDYTITFNTDGTYSGTADCDKIAGTYTTSGNSLTITDGGSTLAYCPRVGRNYRTIDFGTIFTHSLTGAATYAVTNDTLTITLTDGARMTFGPLQALPSRATQSPAVGSLAPGASPPAELLGKTWKLIGITELTPAFQGVVPEADRSKYTIEFQADRTFNAKADCNQVGGTYEVHRGGTDPGASGLLPAEAGGGHMSILPGPSTLAACPPGSLSDLFMIGLGIVDSYGIVDNQLTLGFSDGQPYALQFTA